jgi:hypothetical protein
LTRVVSLKTALALLALVALGLVAAGSAGAVAITSWRGGSGSVPQDVTAEGNCPGTTTTITGTGFVNDGGITSVTIGGVPADAIVVGSDTTLFARVGPGATSGAVTVTTKAGSATAATQAVVLPCQSSGVAGEKPAVDSLVPKSAKAGAKVKLNGIGFVGTKSVTLNGSSVPYAIPSDNVMYIRVPTGTKAGAATIEITNTLGSVKATLTVK